jgi:hypothetical protein
MAARRDNYFQFGKHLDDIANKNAALTNKGVAAGGNSEKFSTMMALVAAIREVMALGDKGVPAEMEPKNVRAWTNGIVANRTKVPRRSFMKQFSMPAAETERLQDMYNEVSTFNQWHSLVRTTWGPIDTKAGALVSSLTTSGLGDY